MERQQPPRLLILSTSLSPQSHSRILCKYAYKMAQERGLDAGFVDLQDHRVLPYGMEGCKGLDAIGREMQNAGAFLIGYPLYNFNMSATLKAVLERFGEHFEGKVTGLMVAAGGRNGYMSVMSVATTLMLDFRTWVVPRFVFASRDEFEGEKIANSDVRTRVEQLLTATYRTAWQHRLPVAES